MNPGPQVNVGRGILKVAFLAILTAGAWLAMWAYERQGGDPARRAADAKAAREAADAADLRNVAGRLERRPQRVAGLLVTDQSEAGGVTRTTLLFQEYAPDGSALPVKRFTITGRGARVEALALQFQGLFAARHEPLRGQTLPLLLRLAGEDEPADAARPVDEPGRAPAAYRGPDVKVSEYEQQLWRELWRLADDEAMRTRQGVRGTPGRAVVGPLEKGKLYTLTLHPDATVTARSEPLKPEVARILEQDEQKVAPQTRPATAPGE